MVIDPLVQIGLQFLNGAVDLLAEGDAIELIEQRFVEALADTVCLRTFGLGPGVVNILDRQVK